MSAPLIGPWQVVETRTALSVKGSDGYTIATLSLGYDRNKGFAEKLGRAKAIAALPDMAEALIGAREWLAGWASADPYLDKINAALEKAGLA